MISLDEPDIPVWSLPGWRYNSKWRNSSCSQHYSTQMWGATSKTRDVSLSFSHRRQAVIKTQWMEKTWYQISDGVTGAKQVHNVAACGDNKEKKWTQPKVPPHNQEVSRERGPLGNTVVMPFRHTHSLLRRFVFRQEGQLPKILKLKCLNSQGALYILTSESLSASPLSPNHHSFLLITSPRAALSSVLTPSMSILLHLPL